MFNDKDIKALAYEKSIDVDRVYKALEDALSTAARKYYKTREPLEAELDRTTGNIIIWVIKEIVEDENQIEDPQAQWTLEQARKVDPDAPRGGAKCGPGGGGRRPPPSELYLERSRRRRPRSAHADPHVRGAENRFRS